MIFHEEYSFKRFKSCKHVNFSGTKEANELVKWVETITSIICTSSSHQIISLIMLLLHYLATPLCGGKKTIVRIGEQKGNYPHDLGKT